METLSQIFRSIGTALLAVLTFFGGSDPTPRFQGYVEADYVRVAPRDSGTLERLGVARGDRVAIGDALFGLDDDAELAARDEARARLTQAEAHLDDLQKGKRAPEINAILAQKVQADASLKLAETQLKRQEGLIGSPAAARDRLDEARATA
ncbi:MAG: biotin/lipoyl-binding protein [Rhodospirillales bacterium]|nr:biotin/lipoyl-binding protein [Rhodospirillales bacterium]